MEIYYQPDLGNESLFLPEDESRHCIRVLRRTKGDKISVVNGLGLRVTAEITEANPRACRFKVLDKELEKEPNFSVQLAIAPTKNQDRIEWFVEKSVELGVDKIAFYFSKHSERKKINLDRIKKKAIMAMKQSGQSRLPEFSINKSLQELIQKSRDLDQKFIAYVDFNNPTHLMDITKKSSEVLVLIGPEGDFSDEELQLALDSGFRKVSLGQNRFRTETAGIAACHILNLINR